MSWEPLATLDHPERLAPPAVNPVVYAEVEVTPRPSSHHMRLGGARVAPLQAPGDGALEVAPAIRAHYMVCELPVRLPSVKPPTDKPNPKIGIGAACLAKQ